MFLSLIIVAVQALLAAAAGWILWKAWRRLARRDATVGRIVGAGILLRAFSAQVLFWISYLGLPIARSRQEGIGFWNFGHDAETYFDCSAVTLRKGWHAIVFVDLTLPSPVFVQILTVFLLLFGFVVIAGALLNLFAYLLCCEAVLRLGRLDGPSRLPTFIALAALSFSPSLVLWSTQPLKDMFFISMVAVFVAACAQWRKSWLAIDVRWLDLMASLVLLVVPLYATSGIRWYFGFLMCAVSLPFLVVTVANSRRLVLAGIVNTLLFALLLQVFVFVSMAYLPRTITLMMKGSAAPPAAAHDLVSVVEKSREGFELSAAKSQIQEGETLARVDRTVKPAPAISVRQSPAGRQPEQVARAVRQPEQAATMPRSTIGRISAGMFAIVIPRFISEWLGFIHVGGGGGLWPVVEADTLLFDLLLVFVIVHAVSAAAAGGLRDPSFWLIGLMTAGITILMTYTISNFGTLFRHRSMILLGLALLLAVSRTSEPSTKAPEPMI
jgi:hypothetical protein